MRRPSPSLIIFILALFVALSGTAYAAVKINGKNIRKGTVTTTQIKLNLGFAGPSDHAFRIITPTGLRFQSAIRPN